MNVRESILAGIIPEYIEDSWRK